MPNFEVEKARYRQYVQAIIKKDRWVNIRITSNYLAAVQARALEERNPYQTLSASVLHKYVKGLLREAA